MKSLAVAALGALAAGVSASPSPAKRASITPITVKGNGSSPTLFAVIGPQLTTH